VRHRILVLAAFAGLLPAQEFRSTITGHVTDPSGASVPNAKIVITKTDTNSRFETVTNTEGLYTAPFLPPGPYELTAEAAGFKKYVHSGIQVGTNERVAADIVLQVGSASESITITGDVPLLNAVTASAGEVVTNHEVENLPMNGRTPLALARNAYGVIPKQKHLLNQVKPYDTSSGVDISLGGGNAGSNEYLLNGVPNMSDASRKSAFSPPMDAVNEVKIELFQADASYGDTSGGTVNIVTKNGTNEYHGTLSEFNQTSALAANQFFLNAAGQKQAVTRSNQYGGTLGGPFTIPKLVQGKDKMFFFFAYEGFKDSSPGVTTTAVPTTAERSGDFSALLGVGSGYQLYDPSTGVLSGTKITRQPFAGNLIPSSRLSAIAKNYLNYFPAPNQAGKATGENNFVVASPSINNYASYIGRMDVNVSERNKLFFNMNTSTYQKSQSDIFHNLATGQYSNQDMWGALVDDVHTFSPTLVLDFRLGYTRSYASSSIKSAGFDATQLGFPSYMAANSTSAAMPRIAFSESLAGLSTSPGSISPFDSTQLFTTVTKVMSRHTLKAGFDSRRYMASSLSPGYSAGTFTFGTNWVTAGTGASSQPFGGGLASFMLGLPTAGQYDVNSPFSYKSWLFGYFIQDDFRLKPNLTINVGLRIEHETPVAEFHDRMTVAWDPNATNAVTAAAQAAYAASPIALLPVSAFKPTGGLIFASPDHRSGYTTPTIFPSPRLGISWAPGKLGNQTVFRGGFGIYNNSIGAYLTGPNTGFSQTTNLVPTNNSYLTPYATLSDPYPGASIQQPVGSANGINTNLGSSVSSWWPNITNPYSIRWNFDVQQQFGKDTLLQVGYIGNKQVHLTYSTSYSQAGLLPFLSRQPTRDQATISALAAVVSNPFKGLLPGSNLNGSTIATSALLLNYPEFSEVAQKNVPGSWGTFNALNVRLQRRFAQGLQASVNYQHSRQLAAAYQLNQGDAKLEYGVTSGDYPDHLALAGSYDLPFGKGQRLLSGSNRWMDALAGGWVLTSVYTWESGGALSWGNVIYYGGPLNMKPRNLAQAFDVTRFERASSAQLSSNYRTFPSTFNNLRSDAANNVDLSLLKSFKIGERVSLQYRFEAFNAFNRTQFAAPNVSPTSSAFGTITSQANVARQIQMGLKLKF
jgi:hypothetical protein